MASRDWIPTGVPGLDRLLRSGLRAGGMHLIAGPPGTGKSILAHQIGARHAAESRSVLYLTVLAESHESLISQATGFDFFDRSQIGRTFYYASLYPILARGGVPAVQEQLPRLVRQHRPFIVIIDGLHTVKVAARNPIEFARFMNEMQVLHTLNVGAALVIANIDTPTRSGPEFTMSDAILRLDRERHGRRVLRIIEIEKLRAGDPVNGLNVFTIGDEGIHIYPRLEAIGTVPAVPPRMSRGPRLAFGIDGFDRMMGGGAATGSATLLAGTPGSGKTLLALSFLADGATRDEDGIFLGFHETPDRLVPKAEGVGIPLSAAVDAGRVRLVWRPAAELIPDELAETIFALVDRHGTRRLVVDGWTDIMASFVVRDRAAPFLIVLSDLLRTRSLGVVYTQELPQIFSLDFTLPLSQISAAIDNIVLLRYTELHARIRRLVSILKMRDSEHDTLIREFEITPQGIRVGEPIREAERLLSGLARVTETRQSMG